MKLLLFLIFCITSHHLFTYAMYKGEFHQITDYPYMAQLHILLELGDTYCGATIISEKWIISVAHCIRRENLQYVQVRVGSSVTNEGGELINVTKIFVHGDHDPGRNFDSDICLLKLETPIKFNQYQQPIKVARKPPKVGSEILVTGYGYHHAFIEGSVLRSARTQVISDEECRKNYHDNLTSNMFCASEKIVDLCFGDSGGPGVVDGKLVGVIAQGCTYNKPNIFTKISNFYDWILKITGIQYYE